MLIVLVLSEIPNNQVLIWCMTYDFHEKERRLTTRKFYDLARVLVYTSTEKNGQRADINDL